MNKVSAGATASNKQTYLINSDPEHQPLGEKVVRGGMWIFGLRALSRGLGLIRTVVLARLLSPSDFGLFGIALLAISIMETFSQTGVQAALIRKKNDIESYLHTAWTISAIRGVILFVILFISAPFIAEFFNSSRAITVIRVIAISTVMSGFKNIGLLYFQKELDFKKQFTYEISGVSVDIITALVLAILMQNVWALVWAGLAGNFVRLVLSYSVQSYRPKLSLQKDKFLELFSFGRWILGSGVLIFLVNQGDDLFVGKMLGVSALGFYQMAYLLSNLPATEVTHVISQISFPAYAKLQSDLQRLKRAYLEIFKTTMFVSFPIAGTIFMLGSDFTEIFLGEKWLPMVASMKVLAIWGLIRSSGGLTGPLFQAINRPDIPTKLLLAKLLLLALIIYPLTIKWGILGTALAVLTNALLINPVVHFVSIRMIGGKSTDILKIVLIPAVSTAAMVCSIAILKKLLGQTAQIHYFIAVAAIGIVSYLICYCLLDKQSVLGKILFTFKQQITS